MEGFPPLSDRARLPSSVLVLAPHPDDEVLGLGGMLAFHAGRGDRVRVVVLTDGAGGASGASDRAATTRLRMDESRAAARELGVGDLRFLGLEDGALARSFELVRALVREIEEFDPELVYLPSPLELHPDHRAASAASIAALARGRERRALCYGVNVPLARGVLFDITAEAEKKRRAVGCFASQNAKLDLVARSQAADRARAINVDVVGIEVLEGFVELSTTRLLAYQEEARRLIAFEGAANVPPIDPWATTAVITTWNKIGDLTENLDGLRAQTRPFASIVVVDNASSDATASVVSERYPEVRLVRMPHSAYGACETFNIGFASAATPLIAILDDDVVLPPNWLAETVERLSREPESTAIVSTEVIEPEMPESYLQAPELARERYMSTFRGCASLARKAALEQAGYYDERLYIYGNERDLTCRLLNRGYRVLQFPRVRAFHKTPFGIKLGKRSLYFHARNAWLTMLKYAPLSDLLRLPWLVLTRVVLRGEARERGGAISDATGTIGIGRSLRETPGAWWVVTKAALNVLGNLPYCWKHREPCRAPDFELPLR